MGLEKFLEQKDVNKPEDFSSVTILRTPEETLSTSSAKSHQVLSKMQGQIDRIAKNIIEQLIRTGGTEIERVTPKIIRGAIEEVYKTPFRLLGNLGKEQFQKIKRRLFK